MTKQIELYRPSNPSLIDTLLAKFIGKVRLRSTPTTSMFVTRERRKQIIDIPFPDRRKSNTR